jgi:hypothetical protein
LVVRSVTDAQLVRSSPQGKPKLRHLFWRRPRPACAREGTHPHTREISPRPPTFRVASSFPQRARASTGRREGRRRRPSVPAPPVPIAPMRAGEILRSSGFKVKRYPICCACASEVRFGILGIELVPAPNPRLCHPSEEKRPNSDQTEPCDEYQRDGGEKHPDVDHLALFGAAAVVPARSEAGKRSQST